MPLNESISTINSTFTTSYNAIDGVGIFLTVVIVLFLVAVVSSLPLYKRFRKYIQGVIGSVEYFVYGVLGIGTTFGIYKAMKVATRYSTKENSYVLLYILGGYIIISMVGYVVKKLVLKLQKHEKEFKKELKKK